MTESRHIPQDELALYAMQTLTPEEATPVRDHLAACPECRVALAEASGDLALVALSVEQYELPQGARQRFLSRVHADATVAREGRPAKVNVIPILPPPHSMRYAAWTAWGAVAALMILAFALGSRIHSLNQQLQQQSALLDQQKAANARAQAVLDLLSAPAAQHVELASAKSRPLPTARAVYLASKGSLLLEASNLDAVPADKIYELWIIPTSGASIPAGLFRPDSSGNASLVLPDLPKGIQAKAFGVTIEVAAGSATPTLPIVLQGAASPAVE